MTRTPTRYICACGAVYATHDALMACQNNRHGTDDTIIVLQHGIDARERLIARLLGAMLRHAHVRAYDADGRAAMSEAVVVVAGRVPVDQLRLLYPLLEACDKGVLKDLGDSRGRE